jgi:hypothetical protein
MTDKCSYRAQNATEHSGCRNSRRSLFRIALGRAATQRAALMRVAMMAAVLRPHAGLTVREIIALLDKEFRWKTNESEVTAKVYTCRDKFVHT